MLGVEWNTRLDHFRLAVTQPPSSDVATKRTIVSDIAKTYDVLGWFSPTIVKVKILLHQHKLTLRHPRSHGTAWNTSSSQWGSSNGVCGDQQVTEVHPSTGTKPHGSTRARGHPSPLSVPRVFVVYLRVEDTCGGVHIALVTSKTKVSPIKRLTIPHLELCGAHLLAQLLCHVQEVFHIPVRDIHAWTDSTIVLSWLVGNPRRFKPYVGNRVSHIVELVPPDRWRHVIGVENPADCASRGLLPSELLQHQLWWSGPGWLSLLRRIGPSRQTHIKRVCRMKRGNSVATQSSRQRNLSFPLIATPASPASNESPLGCYVLYTTVAA